MCKSLKNLDTQIKDLKECLEIDTYFELNTALKQVEKELENNKCIDNLNHEKEQCLDYYDKRIEELEDELRHLYPPILHHYKDTGVISKIGFNVLEFMKDLQIDIEEGNNITGDLEYLIRSLEIWKKELDANVLEELQNKLADEILQKAKDEVIVD